MVADSGCSHSPEASYRAHSVISCKICQFIAKVQERILRLQLCCPGCLRSQEFAVRFRVWMKGFVPACDGNFLQFSGQLLAGRVYKMGHEFLEHELCGRVIGMGHIDIVEAIIAKHIYHQFIGGEIEKVVEFVHQVVHHFQQAGLAAVVIDHAVTKVADGRYGVNDLYILIEITYLVQGIVQHGFGFFDGHHMLPEPLRWRAVAIGNRLFRPRMGALLFRGLFRQAIAEGAAQGDHQPFRFLKELMGGLLRGIDHIQHFCFLQAGETAVVLPALPNFVQQEKVLLRVLFVLHVGDQAGGHALRIEEDAVGILHHFKLHFLQAVADMLGEAGAHQHDGLLVTYEPGWHREIYIDHEIHNGINYAQW